MLCKYKHTHTHTHTHARTHTHKQVFETPEVVRVYVGSFWAAPLKNSENSALFAKVSRCLSGAVPPEQCSRAVRDDRPGRGCGTDWHCRRRHRRIGGLEPIRVAGCTACLTDKRHTTT